MSEERFNLVLRSQRILTTAGMAPRKVGCANGRIVAIEPLGNGLAGTELIELAADETLIPGLVDNHIHVNESGLTEWEGCASATRAAAAGWRHHHHRHAAELHPAHQRRTCPTDRTVSGT
jgi:allantoinase